jgi:hypothetical protein
MDEPKAWTWEVATDVDEIHALVCASDAHTATPAAPAPTRSLEATAWRVRAGAVQVLRYGRDAVATFTLTWSPPLEEAAATFPQATRPAYLGRLAVRPEWLDNGSLVGVQCLRRSIELATGGGADVLRCEANPDLTRVRTLLDLFGFREYGRAESDSGRRRVHLQKDLLAADRTG